MYRATYRNGSGYKTIVLKNYRVTDAAIYGRDTDGDQHVWTTGADLHIQPMVGVPEDQA